MGMVGQETVRPVMLVCWPVAVAVAALGTKHLHRRVTRTAGQPVVLGLQGGKPSRRWVGAAAMRPGMPHLAQHARQQHEGSEQHPDAAGGRLRHGGPGSIPAPRLSITERP